MQKSVHIGDNHFTLIVNEKGYARKRGLRWDGLGGLKFFESPAVGKGWDFPEGPPEDEMSDPGEDSNSEESSDEEVDDEEVDDEEIDEEEIDEEDIDKEEIKDEEVADEPEKDPKGYEGPRVVVNPVPVQWYCKVSSPTHHSVYEVADLLITYLFDLFQEFELGHMSIWPFASSKQLVDKHEKLRTCETLTACDFWTEVHSRTLRKELMEWTLTAVEARLQSGYHINVVEDFKWERGFKSRKINVEYGRWIHHTAILESDASEEFEIYRFLPSSTSLNAILKGWISNEKLRNLKIISWWTNKVVSVTERFQEKVMNGIEEAVVREEESETIDRRFQEMLVQKDYKVFDRFFRRVDGKLGAVFVDGYTRTYRFATF